MEDNNKIKNNCDRDRSWRRNTWLSSTTISKTGDSTFFVLFLFLNQYLIISWIIDNLTLTISWSAICGLRVVLKFSPSTKSIILNFILFFWSYLRIFQNGLLLISVVICYMIKALCRLIKENWFEICEIGEMLK